MNVTQFVKLYNICKYLDLLPKRGGFDGSAEAEVKQILKIGAVRRDGQGILKR